MESPDTRSGMYGRGSCMSDACSGCMSDACRGCLSGSGDGVVSTDVVACCPRFGDMVNPAAGVGCSPGLDSLIKCSHSDLGSCSVKLDGHICPSHCGSLVGSRGPDVGCTAPGPLVICSILMINILLDS